MGQNYHCTDKEKKVVLTIGYREKSLRVCKNAISKNRTKESHRSKKPDKNR